MSNAQKRPAAQNPWYVLATLAREPQEDFIDDRIKPNFTYWNAWASQGMTQKEKRAVENVTGMKILAFPVEDGKGGG